jgi:hypothetical protein
VWLPLGIFGTLIRLCRSARRSGLRKLNKSMQSMQGVQGVQSPPRDDAMQEGRGLEKGKNVLLDPSPAPAVVKELTRRRYLVMMWMALALLCICTFLGFDTASSIVKDQWESILRELQTAKRMGDNQGVYIDMMLIVLPILQTLVELIAKTYLAQGEHPSDPPPYRERERDHPSAHPRTQMPHWVPPYLC